MLTDSGALACDAFREPELFQHLAVDYRRILSESHNPIDGDWDGTGLFAAMACLGVDPRPWLETGPAHLLIFDRTRYPEPGEIEQARTQHTQRYGRPDSNWPSEIITLTRD